MSKKAGSRKKRTRSRPSPSTKRSSASTPTSRLVAESRALHHELAAELFARTQKSSQKLRFDEAVVDGISMWPALRPGYRIRFQALAPDLLAPGDIILVERETPQGTIVQVHRLIGRAGPLFLEAGDNTYSASLVTGSRIRGKVMRVFDSEGKLVELPPWSIRDSRFRFFLAGANAFLFTHEMKDRIVGGRRSRFLWKVSRIYRAGLGMVGLSVPTLFPRSRF